MNVLEVNFRVLAEVDNRAEEVEETLVALEGLEELDERLRGQLLVVLGGDLDNNLQILAQVGLQHCLQTLQRVGHVELSEVVHEPLKPEHNLSEP